MAGLLGTGHNSVLQDLRDTLGRIREGAPSEPRILVLRGESGAGKSRVIRELYEQLRRDQPQPGYWPALPEPEANTQGGDPLANRKRLGPAVEGFVWPAAALPSFIWWEFACDRMPNRDAVDVLAQAAPAVHTHALPASLAWRTAAGWVERAGAARADVLQQARELLAVGGLEAADALLEHLGLAVPGLSLLWKSSTAAIRASQRRDDEQWQLARDVPLADAARAERASTARDVAETIQSVAHPNVPGIVVVEDAHLMGQEFADLLNRLSPGRVGAPVLVVATVMRRLG